MKSAKLILLLTTVLTAISACSDSSKPFRPGDNDNLDALSCDGIRTWDFGASDVLADTQSLVSESGPVTGLGNTRFPCTVLWEYNATFNCSLAFSYEQYLATFNEPDSVRSIGISGANLIVVGNNDVRVTGTPANISATDLAGFPDCQI